MQKHRLVTEVYMPTVLLILTACLVLFTAQFSLKESIAKQTKIIRRNFLFILYDYSANRMFRAIFMLQKKWRIAPDTDKLPGVKKLSTASSIALNTAPLRSCEVFREI